ncbi:MAG: ribosome biogenesis GTPase Der [Ignavibacteriales bacterium]|nr:ribosome biogenesis GTPase Der [Ignavibacteriales bacterium]
MSSNIVAIVGRPNVGKSTLFNRILGAREAIVYDTPGVTRDRNYANAEWAGKVFTLIDTGGYVPESEDVFEKAIREQAKIAIEEADAVVFLVDAVEGITPLDQQIALILRKSNKPVHLVVNKVDSSKREYLSSEFFGLGLGEPLPISALGGRQIGDFLDALTAQFHENGAAKKGRKLLRLAIIGKPNVGKSSLVNALLGKQRSVVTDVPGTTRDSIDSLVRIDGEEYVLVDTAGLRKKSRVNENVEFYSAIRTLKSIENSDVAIILFDATSGVDKQDLHIVQATMERHRSAMIAVNKWDVIEKSTQTAREFELAILAKLGLYDFLPILFISAKARQRIQKVVEKAVEIHKEQQKRIETSVLNKALLPEIQRNPPKTSRPKEIKMKYVTQVKTGPPMFSFFCNEPQLVQESYRRFLEHKIRERFGFPGVPLNIVFRKK